LLLPLLATTTLLISFICKEITLVLPYQTLAAAKKCIICHSSNVIILIE
jgi:hypothetical protein